MRDRYWSKLRWAALAAVTVVAVGGGGAYLVGHVVDPASAVITIDPVRILDTRDPVNVGLAGPFVSPVAQKLQVTGAVPTSAGTTQTVVPAGATGVLLNVTAVSPTGSGFVSIRPGDATGAPSTSSLNVAAGATVPNSVQVGLPTAGANTGQIDITYDALGVAGPTTDVLIDVVGYLVVGAAGGTGPQGPPGPAGPTCPAGGCTMAFTGYSSVPTNAGSTVDASGVAPGRGCRTILQSSGAVLDLPLPIGAKITAITVRYTDTTAAYLLFDLYMVTVPGAGILNPTGTSSISVNGSTTANLVFSAVPPPVSSAAVPYVHVASYGGDLQFCGAVVTYTF